MFRFTTRDLLWLTVVAAFATCWYMDRRSMAETTAKAAADLASERAADKAKLSRELAITGAVRQRATKDLEQAMRMLGNDAHQKEINRLNNKIRQLEGPGYADAVEPTEVEGMSADWWANRARYFEQKFRETQQTKATLPSGVDLDSSSQP